MADYLSEKRKQLKTIKNGKGIQYILNMMYKILGNPAVIYDLKEYKLLACTEGIVTDDPFLLEFLTQGGLSQTTMKFCKDEFWFDAVANGEKVSFVDSDKVKYDRILGELFNKDNILVAGLAVVACERPFEEDDLELIKDVCKIISKELSKSEFFENYGYEFRDTLMKKLIEGSIQDKGYYAPYVADIYDGLKTNLYVAVTDIAQCDPTHAQLTHFRHLFMRTQPAFKYFIYTHYIVIIMSTDEAALHVKKDFKKLIPIFTENQLYVGISSCFDNLFEVQKYYKEAVNALEESPKSNGKQRIFIYAGA